MLAGALGAAIAASLLIRPFAALTGATIAGWILGAASTLALLWAGVVHNGSLTTHALRWLALPADSAPTAQRPPRSRRAQPAPPWFAADAADHGLRHAPFAEARLSLSDQQPTKGANRVL